MDKMLLLFFLLLFQIFSTKITRATTSSPLLRTSLSRFNMLMKLGLCFFFSYSKDFVCLARKLREGSDLLCLSLCPLVVMG